MCAISDLCLRASSRAAHEHTACFTCGILFCAACFSLATVQPQHSHSVPCRQAHRHARVGGGRQHSPQPHGPLRSRRLIPAGRQVAKPTWQSAIDVALVVFSSRFWIMLPTALLEHHAIPETTASTPDTFAHWPAGALSASTASSWPQPTAARSSTCCSPTSAATHRPCSCRPVCLHSHSKHRNMPTPNCLAVSDSRLLMGHPATCAC